MKKLVTNTAFVFLSLVLVGCSAGSTEPTKAPANQAPPPASDDHHQGETNVAPHGHDDMQQMMDDHHQGEENVDPHEHDDSGKSLPPSRSRIKKQEVEQHEHEEENPEPHDH